MAQSMGGVDDIVRGILKERIEAIQTASKRDVIAVYGPMIEPVDVAVRDALGSIKNKADDLLLVLDTNGGVAEVVERLVDTLRHSYKDVAVVVPDHAFSAGTILAMACDSILMDNFSRLGPIDPQVERQDGRLVPALSYLVQFERMREKDKNGDLTAADIALLNKLDLAELHDYELARDLSLSLLKKWLANYKFKDWSVTRTRKLPVTQAMRETRAEEIAKKLSDNTIWYSHGRGISRDVLESDQINLQIDKLEASPDLARSVTQYHDCLVDYMRKVSVILHVHSSTDFYRHYLARG